MVVLILMKDKICRKIERESLMICFEYQIIRGDTFLIGGDLYLKFNSDILPEVNTTPSQLLANLRTVQIMTQGDSNLQPL